MARGDVLNNTSSVADDVLGVTAEEHNGQMHPRAIPTSQKTKIRSPPKFHPISSSHCARPPIDQSASGSESLLGAASSRQSRQSGHPELLCAAKSSFSLNHYDEQRLLQEEILEIHDADEVSGSDHGELHNSWASELRHKDNNRHSAFTFSEMIPANKNLSRSVTGADCEQPRRSQANIPIPASPVSPRATGSPIEDITFQVYR